MSKPLFVKVRNSVECRRLYMEDISTILYMTISVDARNKEELSIKYNLSPIFATSMNFLGRPEHLFKKKRTFSPPPVKLAVLIH